MSAQPTIATRWSRALGYAEKRLPALTRLKKIEPLPIRLDRHRIYVLPTRFGLIFSVVLVVMLLGALNYNNNPAMLLTCLLAAASYQSVFQSFRTLNGVQLTALRAHACHAGGSLPLSLHFHIDTRIRRSLRARIGDYETVFDLQPDSDGKVRIELPAPRRGWQTVGRIKLYSEYPFGLFQVWSWLNPDFAALVYPRLEADAPPLPNDNALAVTHAQRGRGDELAMLRDYRPSDPLRGIAWKASARHDTLLVKEFELQRGREIVLSFASLIGLDRERRISRLARWVCAAESAQVRYTLQLPSGTVGPGLGSDHRHACLRELAVLFGGAE
ncbi:MAG TPA: DUF58 domain-containing protein [Rudaea sp.]|nr:DUF58 domain-containing protein [Rudaea sp.]